MTGYHFANDSHVNRIISTRPYDFYTRADKEYYVKPPTPVTAHGIIVDLCSQMDLTLERLQTRLDSSYISSLGASERDHPPKIELDATLTIEALTEAVTNAINKMEEL